MTPPLDVIIVNWNAGDQLCACVASVVIARHHTLELRRVVVVDNASTDGSANGLGTPTLPLTIIRNVDNIGFAKACNQGAAGSKSDYLLFLNPDTRLLADSLVKPIDFMEQPGNGKVGICGIQLADENGKVNPTCARFPTPGRYLAKIFGLDRLFPAVFPPEFMTEWKHADNRAVDQVMGAFFLVRRSLFERLGGFDERFFVYFEDADFSYRAHKAGWSSYYLANAHVYHRGRGTSEQIKGTRLFYSLRSRLQYAFKHFGRLAATAVALGTLLLEPIARLALSVARGSGSEAMATLVGYTKLWCAIPQLVRYK